jgi:microcystin-dependent protein
MVTPYIGEIRLFGFGRIPIDWAACNGQLLRIAEYEALFTLIGTTYGGDGITTFGLPDLRGRVPLSLGQGPGLSNYVLGQRAGQEQVTLVSTQIPSHSHSLMATANPGTTAVPGTGVHLAATTSGTMYAPPANVASMTVMAPISVSFTGDSQPHDNMMPTLVANYCISLYGIFPSPG